jgi:hypothetical protein
MRRIGALMSASENDAGYQGLQLIARADEVIK